MRIVSRLCISADGYVATPEGWPVQVADPTFVPGQSHGLPEFLHDKETALMGRTTFEPALSAGRWPWPGLDVFVLASRRPAGTPDHVVTDDDPSRLLDRMWETNRRGDIQLIGGPCTIDTYRALGALDELQLVVLPLLLGDGMRLTPALSLDTSLTLQRERALPGGAVELAYSIR